MAALSFDMASSAAPIILVGLCLSYGGYGWLGLGALLALAGLRAGTGQVG